MKNNFYTSKKTIKGLRHFVIVNKYKLHGEYFFHLVSLLDSEINFRISKKEFEKSDNWQGGFIDYSKNNFDFKEYNKFKLKEDKGKIEKILLSDNSPFNIS
tara:strand:+ start:467 stop:769 length:303 start_codon:yes stop_codon:yes gene_type:complete